MDNGASGERNILFGLGRWLGPRRCSEVLESTQVEGPWSTCRQPKNGTSMKHGHISALLKPQPGRRDQGPHRDKSRWELPQK